MRRSTYLMYLVVFLFPLFGIAQNQSFEDRYRMVYSDIIAKDVGRAFRIADSLLRESQNPEEEIKALMLLAKIHHSTGNYALAIKNALKSEKKAELAGYYEWTTRSCGFLASSFREVGLLEESARYLENTKSNSLMVKDSAKYALIKSNILQEESFLKMADLDYKGAIKLIESAMKSAAKNDEDTPRAILVKANNNQLLGVCYMEIGQYVKAENCLRSSLIDLGNQESNLKPYIFRALAEIFRRQKTLDSCKKYIDLAYPYVQSADRMELKLLVYETYNKYYNEVRDLEKSNLYLELYQQILIERSENTKKVANELIRTLRENEKLVKRRNLILMWGIFIFGGIGLIIYIHNYRRKNSIYSTIIDKKTPVYQEPEVIISPRISLKEVPLDNDLNISLDTENRLLKDLNQLEREMFFLDKNITLTKLSNKLLSNQKYVSFIIRKYRNQNFNDYILNMRIQYLIEALSSNSMMLDYKLSYLADYAGFSSHSKFTMAFKAVVGIPPSQYIEELRLKNARN